MTCFKFGANKCYPRRYSFLINHTINYNYELLTKYPGHDTGSNEPFDTICLITINISCLSLCDKIYVRKYENKQKHVPR